MLVLLSSCGRTPSPGVAVTHSQMFNRHAHFICLDPGHGGHDEGTSNRQDELREKELNLSTTLATADHLRSLGYRVMLTRETDVFVPLRERAEMANEAGCDLFISIHFNAAQNRDAEGVEVHIFPAERLDTERERLGKAVIEKVIRYTHAASRGIKHSNFAVLRHSEMPAVLIEGGFFTNAKERELLKTERYRNAIAWGITQGIESYFARSN